MSEQETPSPSILSLPALLRLLCVVPALGALWGGVFWALG